MGKLIAALVISVIVCLGLGVALVGANKDHAVEVTKLNARIQEVERERDTKGSAANECSQGVDRLAGSAQENKAEGEKAHAAIKPVADKLKAKADVLLAAPAPVPGDVCGSAQDRVDEWLKGRAL